MVVVTTLFFKVFGIENWSIICCLWAILPLVNFVFYIFVPIAQLNDNDEGEPLPLGKLFTVKILWVFMLLMLCSGAAEQAMSQWASFFAETELGVSKQVADLLGPCMFAVAMGSGKSAVCGAQKVGYPRGTSYQLGAMHYQLSDCRLCTLVPRTCRMYALRFLGRNSVAGRAQPFG